MPLKTEEGIILLIDHLEMRRACLQSVLGPWAKSVALELVAMSLPKFLPPSGGRKVRLLVINLGGASVSSLEVDGFPMVAKEIDKAPYAIISDRADPEEAIAAAELGFQAFLPAALPVEIVKQALTFILGGGTYFPREALLANQSAGAQRNGGSTKRGLTTECLTSRQNEVLERLRFGKSNKHIARELNMQEATVKVHVRQIMRKLGAANRTQAALLAQSSFNNPPLSGENDVLTIPPPEMINGMSMPINMGV